MIGTVIPEPRRPRCRSAKRDYSELVDILEAELAVVADGFEGLTAGQWGAPTNLARSSRTSRLGHCSNLPDTSTSQSGSRPCSLRMRCQANGKRSATPSTSSSFPATIPTEFYSYAYEVVQDRDPSTMSAVLRSTFAQSSRREAVTLAQSARFQATSRTRSFAWTDFVSTRIVESVIHGMDLTDVTGQPSTATLPGIAHTAGLLDSLLTRSSVGGGRPSDLTGD